MKAYRLTIDGVPYYATQLKDRISLILVNKENQFPILSSEVVIDNTHELYQEVGLGIKTSASIEEPDTYDSVSIKISFTPLVNNLYRKEATYEFNYDVVEGEVLEITRAVPDGKDGEIQDTIVPAQMLMDFSILTQSFLNNELNEGVEEETLSYGDISRIELKDDKTLELKCGPDLVRSELLSKYKARQLLSRL